MTMDNQQEIQSFVSGLFDAEGWVSYRKKNESEILGFVNTDQEIIGTFIDYLKLIGCRYCMCSRKRKKHYKKQYQITLEGIHQTKKLRENFCSIKFNQDPKHISWLLGFLDGDGSVGISKLKNRNKVLYKPHIYFFNTDVRIIDKVKFFLEQENIPYYADSTSKNRNKTKYRVIILGLRRCKVFLDKLLNYAGAKKERLELVDLFINSRLNRPRNSLYSDQEILYHDRLKILND